MTGRSQPPTPAQEPVVDAGRLAEVMVRFVAQVAEEFTTHEVLTELLRAAVDVLDVDGAGVMLPDHGSLLRAAMVTGSLREAVAEAEHAQELLQEGPCRDSHLTGTVVDVADLETHDGWPRYRRCVARHGVHGVTAVPLRARGRGWGVLDLYRTSARPLSPSELAAARALADLAASVLVIDADRWAAGITRDELVRRAMHDPLTDLPVSRVLLEQLGRALARLARRDGGLVAVLYLDLDGLKYVNDTYGHAAGDQLLLVFARRVRAVLRPSDLLARVGGDEFVVLLDDLTRAGDAHDVAHRVLTALRAPHRVRGQDLVPSASVGVAVTADPTTAPETLVAHADSAMYRAKHAGRGRVDAFDPVGYARARVRANRGDRDQGALSAALDDDQLLLHYQPVHHVPAALPDVAAPVPVAVEALLRWQRPGHGLLSAAEFLPDAEASGLMIDLGAWVLRTACTQLAAWDADLGPRSPQALFVNVSALELTDPDLPHRVSSALSETGVAPARLVLELTETALVSDEVAAVTTAHALLDVGCRLAMDDFGTGYSSLRRLVDLPTTVLKVDRSFTRDLLTSPATAAVVATILRLGRDLDRTVVVEGIEDAATQQAMLDLGATHLQGYHLTRPCPARQITALLAGADVGPAS